MVVRIKKKSRKYLGKRRWGAGNIKNNRGAGERGGVGKAGRKHKWTRIVVYERERMHKKKGFFRLERKNERLEEINLNQINRLIAKEGGEKPVVELPGYKVLGSGSLSKPAVIKASAFSENATKKIEKVNGEAVLLSQESSQKEG